MSFLLAEVHLGRIYAGMKLIEDSTRGPSGKDCIKFVPRTTEQGYLRIMNHLNGCWSYVGRQSGGNQPVSIDVAASNCAYTGIVAHELIHALGLFVIFFRFIIFDF